MPQYLLLLYDEPAGVEQFRKLPPAEMQKAMQQYLAWSDNARQKGFFVASNKLTDGSGRVVRSSSGKPNVTDGPFSEAKEILGGYYIIEAPNYNEAVQRILDHPHLAHGTIALREIEVIGSRASTSAA